MSEIEENKEVSPTAFDGVLPDAETNQVRETEYVADLMISAENILDHMHPNEALKFFNNLLVESADSSKHALFQDHGKKAQELVRDFYKSIETWMRKHKIKKFNEQFALVSIVNASMALSIQKNVVTTLEKLGEKEAPK